MSTGAYGAQIERTRLAWRRTVLTLSVTVLLFTKPVFGAVGVSGADVGALGVVALLWLGALGVAHRRIRGVEAEPPPSLGPGTVWALVGMVLGVAAVGLVVVAG